MFRTVRRLCVTTIKATQLSPEGDSYAQDGNTLLIKVPLGPLPGGLAFVAQTTFAPPESVVRTGERLVRSDRIGRSGSNRHATCKGPR